LGQVKPWTADVDAHGSSSVLLYVPAQLGTAPSLTTILASSIVSAIRKYSRDIAA
jgi:hypothetical protein